MILYKIFCRWLLISPIVIFSQCIRSLHSELLSIFSSRFEPPSWLLSFVYLFIYMFLSIVCLFMPFFHSCFPFFVCSLLAVYMGCTCSLFFFSVVALYLIELKQCIICSYLLDKHVVINYYSFFIIIITILLMLLLLLLLLLFFFFFFINFLMLFIIVISRISISIRITVFNWNEFFNRNYVGFF